MGPGYVEFPGPTIFERIIMTTRLIEGPREDWPDDVPCSSGYDTDDRLGDIDDKLDGVESRLEGIDEKLAELAEVGRGLDRTGEAGIGLGTVVLGVIIATVIMFFAACFLL